MTVVKILIVRDEHNTALELQDRVETTVYDVIAFAADVEEAVEQAHALHPDIILMDFDLFADDKKMDAVHEVKLQFDVPVVFVTTNLNAEVNANIGLDSLSEFLQSPFEIHELQRAIDKAYFRREMEQKLAESEKRMQTLLSEIAIYKKAEALTEGEKEKSDVLLGVRERCYQSLDLSWVLKIVCEETIGALGVTAASILLYDEKDDTLRLVEDVGLQAEFRLRHKPVLGADYKKLLRQVSPVAIILNGDDEPCLTNAQLYRSLGIKAVMISEMCVQDELLGYLNVFIFDQDQHFAYDDLGLLQSLADIVARPIANSKMFDENQLMLDHLELAYDSGIVLNNLQDPLIQIESLLQIVMATQGVDRVTYYRYESGENGNLETSSGWDHQLRQGTLVYENGLGHSPEAYAGLQPSRIEMGDEDDFVGWVATNLAPLYCADIRSDPRFGNADSEMRSVFGVPIERNRELVGVLLVMSRCLNAFDIKKQMLLRRLADQTSVAIKNARTLAQIRQDLSEQRAKNRIYNALMGANDLNDMASIYLNELLAVLEADIGALWLYNTAEDVLVQLIGRGIHPDRRRIQKAENILWQIYKQREVHLAGEFRTDPHVGEDIKEIFPLGVGGALVPLIDDEEFIGVCLVGMKQPREMTMNEVNLLSEITSVASGAISTMSQLENTKRSLEQSRGLQVIDQVISASMDLRFIFKVILDKVIELLHVDASDVLLLNMHTQTLEFAAGQGFQTAALQHTHLKLGQGHAGKAAIERRIVNIPNLMEDRNGFERAPLLLNERFTAYYAIPLISKGQIMGVMELFHRTPHEADLEWRKFLKVIATQAAIAIDNARLFENLQRTNAELMLAYDTTLEGWSRALELHDRTAQEQSDRAADMATQLARELGVSDYDEIHIRRGAILHDIGKMGIPEDILNKDGPLTEEEWDIMRQHPVHAYDLLSPIPYLRPALDIPYCHHERWDGTGYPVGLIGEQIPLAARIFAIVDVWDSMLSNRPYREALPEDEVLSYINNNAGKQFDPTAVQAFMNIVV